MKIYTEEQVRQAFRDGFLYALTNEEAEDVVINALTPIELPNDEEIEDKNPYKIGGGNYNSQAAYQWKRGVEWVIEQIKKQK